MTQNRLRRRFQFELLLLLILTAAFLMVMPHGMTVFIPTALIFLIYVLIDARFTQKLIWPRFEAPPGALKQAFLMVAVITLPPLIVMLVLGVYLGHGILTLHVLEGLGLYLGWALVQQTLFQVYFLGRLRVIFPNASNLSLAGLNGLAYALVHLPQIWLALATVPLGILWTLIYIRYQKLLPLALSHALLATAFYYWVLNRDLIVAIGQ